jgi:hypothetical protein
MMVPEGDGPGRCERGFGDTTGTVPFGEEKQVGSYLTGYCAASTTISAGDQC